MNNIPKDELDSWINEQKKSGNQLISTSSGLTSVPTIVTEQMDYKNCLLRQIDQSRWALLYGLKPFQLNVLMLLMMIPETIKDAKFKEDLEKAKTDSLVFTGKRTYRAGGPSEICMKTQKPDFFAVFEACINLFSRRGMLFNQQQIEVV